MSQRSDDGDSCFADETYRGYRVRICLVRDAVGPPRKVRAAKDVYELFHDLGSADRELLYALHLDSRNQVTGCEEVSRGSLSQSLVHPREVYKGAILSNAASVIVAHNHPSGDPSPSSEDHAVTTRLHQAGELLGIPLLDSLIIGCTDYYSIRESGHAPWG